MRTQDGETGDSEQEDSRALADKQFDETEQPRDEDGGGMLILDDLGGIASLQRSRPGLPRSARSFPLNRRFTNMWEIPDGALERMVIENDLRRALEQREFVVYLQPQADVRTNDILGVEALARWQHPDRGLLLPEEFIPHAEQLGLISQLDAQVLRTACCQSRAREDAGLPSLRLAVNLSAPQFQDPRLVHTISGALDECRLAAHSLEVEITETVAMKNAAFAIQVLTELHALGVDIALDDFGTGYSSLQYLKDFPIHTLKIDRTFIQGVGEQPNDEAIVSAIIAIGHSLGLKVIAEGIEREDQLAFLRERQCDWYQGFLLSEPVPTDTFNAMLQRRAA